MSTSDPNELTPNASDAKTVKPGFGAARTPPSKIGRYTIDRLLGKGGFGCVYLAHDEELDRFVAVKIPHRQLVSSGGEAMAYLNEARTVANLDHPNIVPVHDIGSTPDVFCYVVSKYIEGEDLALKIKSRRFTWLEAAELVKTVAGALHYAHRQGLVHRDVKPGNILIDAKGQPFVVDFGLALREQDIGKGPRHAGTTSYMSPEQARGEGHRVDGRSDVFSLGVVLYQLLVGRRPFRGDSTSEILSQILDYDPRPIRQHDESIPKELQRICNRALAKRLSERYPSAHDLADDLQHFLSEQRSADRTTHPTGTSLPEPWAETETVLDGHAESTPASVSGRSKSNRKTEMSAIKVVPKGLRSYDAHDADFFLELLPGPRDRSGLPDIVRFWKTRIEELDPDQTFPVGLIYGQSGCGKSSLIKAGLIPRLAHDIVPIYIEATPDETETRLLRSLRKRVPTLDPTLNLKDSLHAIRCGMGTATGIKVLLVIDQFEQWLHSSVERKSQLVDALRQCDGGRVQCIVMVRDDFWMAATRFMRELDLQLQEGKNSAAAELFPIRHATKVLTAFGRAFGSLPEEHQMLTAEQKQFLDAAIAGLSEDGKVVCVRLTLFAEMMKDRKWSLKSLKEVGGTQGVGATFLEETFNASTAPPQHRYHQIAARRVLEALLPDSGTDIKGEMKSHEQLLEVSGYADRPHEFDELIHLLDQEIRLVTPTDPDGRFGDEDASSRSELGSKYYQLTHDYLVHSLRDWLTRKQRESRRGRAELQLKERVSVWDGKREARYLPSIFETLNIRWQTDQRDWSIPQREMMLAAVKHYATRMTGIAAAMFLVVAAAWWLISSERDRNTQSLIAAATDALQYSRGEVIPYALRELLEFPSPMVTEELNRRTAESGGQQSLSLEYAMAALGKPDYPFLVDKIRRAPAIECANFVNAFAADPEKSLDRLVIALKTADGEQDWSGKARLAIIALQLGETNPASEMLSAGAVAHPIERSAFIEEFWTWHSNPVPVAKSIAQETDPRFVSGIILCLGGITTETLSAQERMTCQSLFERSFQENPDRGVHASADWALRRWNIQSPMPIPIDRLGNREWMTTSNGIQMMRLSPGTLKRSLNTGETESISFDSDLWIGDREITVTQFLQFVADEKQRGGSIGDWAGPSRKVSPTDTHPVQTVSWFEAIQFCNWLSDREDLKRCYTESEQGWAVDLSADGYRLPSDAEWEYACRAGTNTRYSCGDQTFLHRYAQYRKEDSAKPSGSLLPNSWGLFDMHGNVWEWVGNVSDASFLADPNSMAGKEALRGGSRGATSFGVSSSSRSWHVPTHRSLALGFRIARTP